MRHSFKKIYALYTVIGIILFALVYYFISTTPFGSYNLLPGKEVSNPSGRYDYEVPLDPQSPWPKFRANVLQNGQRYF